MSFEAGADADVRLAATLADGRRIRPPAERAGRAFNVGLRTLDGLGQASFVVEATKGFRTARASTEFVTLPPPSVHGWIVEPVPGSEWPFGRRGSLMANLNDGNGRRLSWSQVAWVADGQRLQVNTQVVPWESRDPGDRTIQLVLESESGPRTVLDEVKLTVLPQTAEQNEYEELQAARKAKRIVAPEAACGSPPQPVPGTHET